MNTLVFENGHSGTEPLRASATHNIKSSAPDPQVIQKPTRRHFSVADKLRILKEADACHGTGELGALLRREGLYSSSLANFRKQRAEGRLRERNDEQKVTQRKHKEAARQRDARRLIQMEKQIQQLTALLELQKKLSDLLGIHLGSLKTNDDCE